MAPAASLVFIARRARQGPQPGFERNLLARRGLAALDKTGFEAVAIVIHAQGETYPVWSRCAKEMGCALPLPVNRLAWLIPTVIGTLLNVFGILAGGVAGSACAWHPSIRIQQWVRLLLGAMIMLFGFRTCWLGLRGTWRQMLATLAVVLLAMAVGRLVGRLLGLQQRSNRTGRQVRELLAAAARGVPPNASRVFVACSGLFCLTPLAVLGSVMDGLTGDYRLLAMKGIMEGLAAMAMVRVIGWGTVAAALPVLAVQGSLSLGLQALAPVVMRSREIDVMSLTAGVLASATALLVFEVKAAPSGRPIHVADYLPSMMLAPLLAHLFLW